MAIEEDVSQHGLHYLSCRASTTNTHNKLRGLMFLHGNGSRASEYSTFLEDFSQLFPSDLFVAPSLPGHEKTPTTACPEPTVHGFANLVLELIQQLGYNEIVLCGHSMSTRIMVSAFHVARSSHPGLVTGLIFLDGSNARMRNAQRLTLQEGQNQPAAPSMEQNYRNMFLPTSPPSFVEEAVQHIKSRSMPYIRTLRDSYFHWDVEDSEKELKEVGQAEIDDRMLPVLLLQSTDVDSENRRKSLRHGERTTYMKYISSLVPQTEMVVVEDAGHFLHIDQSEKVGNLILGFYQSIYPLSEASG